MDILIPVESPSRNNRAADLSEFKDLYEKYEDSTGVLDAADECDSSRFSLYSQAIRSLHVSVIPGTLPCRSLEKDKILSFLREGIRRGGHMRPLYISGMPGSGKTACFLAALRTLQEELQKAQKTALKQAKYDSTHPSGAVPLPMVAGFSDSSLPLPPFRFVEINCLKLHSPSDAYSVLWRGISGERVSSSTALLKLNDYFTISNNKKLYTEENEVIVCLLDELDFLVTGNESVVYNFFDWPQLPRSSLIVIGIANTMDLPERLSFRARSRMGGDQTNRMIFQPYTFDQVLSLKTYVYII